MPPIFLTKISDKPEVLSSRTAAMPIAARQLEPFQWLNNIFSADRRVVLTTKPLKGYRVLQEYAVITLSADSFYLMPVGTPETVRRAFQMYTPETRLEHLMRQINLQALVRGVVPPHLRRVYWCVRDDVDYASFEDLFLLSHLRDQLDDHRIEFAIHVKTDADGKRIPHIIAIDPNGQTVGYVHIGVDEVSNTRILNDTHILNLLASENFRSFDMPRVLHESRWLNYRVAVQSVPTDATYQAPHDFQPFYRDVLFDLSKGYRRQKPLEINQFWLDMLYRVEGVRAGRDYDLMHQGVSTIVERLGNKMLPFHVSHGNFVPSNVEKQSHSGRPFLYNWHDASLEKPVGWDIFHFFTETMRQGNRSADDAVTALSPDGELHKHLQTHMRRMHLQADATHALFTLYLVDRLCDEHTSQNETGNYLRDMLEHNLQVKRSA
jgi:hypothetical protein